MLSASPPPDPLQQVPSLRILAIHAGMHDSSAAAFDDYRDGRGGVGGAPHPRQGLGRDGAVALRSTRCCGSPAGGATTSTRSPPRAAGSRRYDYRFPLWRELHYTFERWRGRERTHRELAVLCHRFGIADTHKLFRADRFLKDNSFRPDTQIHFVNHHEAHALAALFYTDWDDALVYTSDGIGDNVSYSMRGLKDGKLECHYGDDRWLTKTLKETGLASAYGYATVACGFRMLRHEGKLTGLAAYGEPKLADEMAAQFRFNDSDGLIETDFRNWFAMREKFLAICKGHDRETIAASIQKVAEDFTRAVGALVAASAPARASSRWPAGCSPMCGSTGCSPRRCRSTRCSSFPRWATTACRSAPR